MYAAITVERDAAVSSTESSVTVNLSHGTTNASDFTSIPLPGGTTGVINFGIGVTSATIQVRIKRDTDVEPDETFFLTLNDGAANGSDLGTPSVTEVTIIDDDDASNCVFDAASYSATETAATATASVRVLRTSKTEFSQYVTVKGLTNTFDLTPSSLTLTFAPGESEKIFTFSAVDDSTVEGEETVTLEIQNQSGLPATNPARANLVIADNDLVNISLGDATVTEGTSGATQTVTLPITLSKATPTAISLNAFVVGGTADSQDIILNSSTISIAETGAERYSYIVPVKRGK